MSRRLLAASVLVALAAAGVPRSAGAQAPLADPAAWGHLGPQKLVLVEDIAFTGDPSDPTVWVDNLGTWKLPPRSSSWTVVSSAARGPLHLDLFGSPPDTLFVGDALWRSTDGGQTFRKLTSSAGGEYGNVGSSGALGRVPAGAPHAGRLVVGDGLYENETFGPGFLYSDDAGDTWTRAEASPTIFPFRMHAFRSGRVLAAGFYGATLSDDGARTFRTVPQLYETAFIGFDLTEKTFLGGFTTSRTGDSAEGRILLLGTQAGRPKVYLWASDDEGTTWHEAHAFDYDGSSWGGIDPVPTSVGGGPGWAVATSGAGIVYATTDGGETWTVLGQVPETGPTSGLPTRASSTAVGPDGRLYAGVGVRGNTSAWSWITKGRIADAIRVAVASEEATLSEILALGVSVRPNPAGSRAEVVLRLSEAQTVRVAVFDVQSREVVVLLDGAVPAGERRLRVDTSAWPAGVYVVRVSAEAEVTAARLVVAR